MLAGRVGIPAMAAELATMCAFAEANPVATENELPGDSFWTIAIAPETSIAGYFSEVSAKPGDVVHLHVSVPSGDRYRVGIHRLAGTGALGGDVCVAFRAV